MHVPPKAASHAWAVALGAEVHVVVVGKKLGASVVGLTVGSELGLDEGIGVGIGVGDGAGIREGIAVGVEEGDELGFGDGWADGIVVGRGVGTVVGVGDGAEEGNALGEGVGGTLGRELGVEEGRKLGNVVGASLGSELGVEEGSGVGSVVGGVPGSDLGINVGVALGTSKQQPHVLEPQKSPSKCFPLAPAQEAFDAARLGCCMKVRNAMETWCTQKELARGSGLRNSNRSCLYRSRPRTTVHRLMMNCTRPESEHMCPQKLLRTLGRWRWEPRCTLRLWGRSLVPKLA